MDDGTAKYFFLNGIAALIMLTLAEGCRVSHPGQYTLLPKLAIEARVTMPTDSTDSVYAELRWKDDVIAFYESNNHELVWYDSASKPLPVRDSLIDVICKARYFGLLPQNYHIDELKKLVDSTLPIDLVRTDALVTDAFFGFTADIKYGRTMRMSENRLDSASVPLLRQVLDGSNLRSALHSMEPPSSQYQSLKVVLKTILDTTELEVRQRILNGETDDSLPVIKIIKSIEINLEKRRLERDFSPGGRCIYVNIPSFMLDVVDGDKTVLKSKVIVGTQTNPTPEITSLVECIVIYPYWHVPRKISVEEYLPILQRDTSFLTRNNFDVLDRKGKVLSADSIDWKKFSKNYFPVSLRQHEGKENSLGVVKFVFDNPYAVFLHDTNAKYLFRNRTRAFSHGCIRVEKAVELAHYLFTGDLTKKSKVIDKYIVQEQRQTLSLRQPIPIYLRYFTCEVIDDRLYQYQDIYNKDAAIMLVLYSAPTIGDRIE